MLDESWPRKELAGVGQKPEFFVVHSKAFSVDPICLGVTFLFHHVSAGGRQIYQFRDLQFNYGVFYEIDSKTWKN